MCYRMRNSRFGNHKPWGSIPPPPAAAARTVEGHNKWDRNPSSITGHEIRLLPVFLAGS
ncbi:Histone-lysine N-methyltransferase SETD2 [Anopheles sinensis]|uniref:Histone-lysine N-methyltransferase SETD2 n=1 Tax=Anopheles sinensis TaxID=74873 RepID=A0A084VTT6_ANOSI|nr:Histone-lysine N-methyltransferase SETD2 [Anopheles sinensis]